MLDRFSQSVVAFDKARHLLVTWNGERVFRVFDTAGRVTAGPRAAIIVTGHVTETQAVAVADRILRDEIERAEPGLKR